MPNTRVAIPSHINTIPFLFGLQHHEVKRDIDLTLLDSNNTIDWLKENKADLALVSVEMLHDLENFQLVSNFCISAQREMHPSILCINGKTSNLTTIYLDSKLPTTTSVVHILANKYWKCHPTYMPLPSEEKAQSLKPGEGVVLVKDEAMDEFPLQDNAIDLSSEWKKFTGLPLVTAVWISLKPLPRSFTEQFDNALRMGVNNIDAALMEISSQDFPKAKVRRHLSQGISYMFDHEKKVSMLLFLKLQAQQQKVLAI